MKWREGGNGIVCVSSCYHFFLLSWLDYFFGNAKNQTLNIFITFVKAAIQENKIQSESIISETRCCFSCCIIICTAQNNSNFHNIK